MTALLLLAFTPSTHASPVGFSLESGGLGVAHPSELGPLDAPGQPDFQPPPGFGLPGWPDVDGPVSPDGIVNGTNATPDDFRAVVNFVSFGYGNGFPFCSGTLIDDQWVLTAAHCIDGQQTLINRGEMWVFVTHDIYNLTAQDESIEVVEGYIHPSWNPNTLAGDLAIVRLASSPRSAEPMVVNDEPINNRWMGTDLTFVGFGITSDGGSGSGRKRWATIAPYYYDNWVVYSSDNQQNVCNGDSGGAAFEVTPDGYELAGVNSFVFNPGCVGGDNGAARVATQLDWIRNYADPATDWSDRPEPEPEPEPEPGPTGDDDDDDDAPGGLGNSLGAGDAVEFDDVLSDPVRPDGGLPTGVACNASSGSAGALLGLVGLLGLRRRR